MRRIPGADALGLPLRGTLSARLSGAQLLFVHLLTFAIILGLLKANQFLYFSFETNPAIILLPTGIALAITYLFGYSFAIPIGAAWLVATYTNPANPSWLTILITPLAYALTTTLGAYVLKRFEFTGTLDRTRSALTIVALSLALPVIVSSVLTATQFVSGTLTASLWLSWTRTWAGNVMSILIFTPLITSWWGWWRRGFRNPRVSRYETLSSLALLSSTVYVTFWTQAGRAYSFIALYSLFAILFWIGLRMRPRIMTLALLVIAALGMAGAIIAQPYTGIPLNAQLLNIELFLILIAPIFLLLTALVEERSTVARQARERARELEEVNRRLSREDRSKNEFIAMLAHELRNPLSPVMSALELLRYQSHDRPDLVELIDVADAHTRSLSRLLDDLLDISRVSRKKFKLNKEVIDLARVIESVKRSVDMLYKSRWIDLQVVTPSEPIWIEADALRIEQILTNILNNAAKYSEPNTKVTLSVERANGGGLRIKVRDEGRGISAAMLKRIFDPFIQGVDGVHTGLGVGLSITKRLVHLHGGTVWAESEGEGKGSTFIIEFPDSIMRTPLMLEDTRDEPTSAQTESTRPLEVLVVDDNVAAAEGLARLLRHFGHTVSVAHSGAAALEFVERSDPHVVLLDIGMPDMNGYEVARAMREQLGDRTPTLIALTGYGQETDKAKALGVGFAHHLVKPVQIRDVESVLQRVPVRERA